MGALFKGWEAKRLVSKLKLHTKAASTLQASWRQFLAAEKSIHTGLTDIVSKRKDQIIKEEGQVFDDYKKETLNGLLLVEARRVFHWTAAQAEEMATILSTVRMLNRSQGLLELLELLIEDDIGRRRIGSAMPRHVVITGGVGTGKRTAAMAITKVLSILNPELDPLMEDENIDICGAAIPSPVLQDLTARLRESMGGGIAAGQRTKKAVHFRLPCKLNGDRLEDMTAKGHVAILTGDRAEVDKFMSGCMAMKKRAPRRIDLDFLSHEELASVALRVARRQGYVVKAEQCMLVTSDTDLMNLIVRETYTKDQIKAVNLYNVPEMIERAITNKNTRLVGGIKGLRHLEFHAEDYGSPDHPDYPPQYPSFLTP